MYDSCFKQWTVLESLNPGKNIFIPARGSCDQEMKYLDTLNLFFFKYCIKQILDSRNQIQNLGVSKYFHLQPNHLILSDQKLFTFIKIFIWIKLKLLFAKTFPDNKKLDSSTLKLINKILFRLRKSFHSDSFGIKNFLTFWQ